MSDAGGRIAAGLYHSFVVKEDSGEDDCFNQVYGFGSNRNHMLGLTGNHVVSKPTTLSFFDDKYIWEVECGGSHSVFLEKRPYQEGGRVWAVGLGTSGRLGLKRPCTRDEFEDVLRSSGYTDLGKHATEADAIIDSERVRSWCFHTPVLLRSPESFQNIVSISCGVDHTLALTEPGRVFAWGLGSFGNLGTGSTDDAFTPEMVKFPDDNPCSRVAAGAKHSMALTREQGLMFSWGHGGSGRLGQGDDRKASLVPREVEVNSRVAMQWIAAGEAHSASIDALGNVFCWGCGTRGRTGHGKADDSPVPKVVHSLEGSPCAEVALGALHSMALARSGAVYTWGSGHATGHEAAGGAEAVQPIPKELTCQSLRLQRVVHIAAGSFHSLALLLSGDVLSWGNGSHGRLGHGSAELGDEATPVFISWGPDKPSYPEPERAEEDRGQQSICCGGMHSGLLRASELWLWGSNEYGQLGFGNTDDRPCPSQLIVQEIALHKMKIHMLALGLEHCFLITAASAGAKLLYAWGRNHVGQLGLGNTVNAKEPTLVRFIVDVKNIAAGEDHSAAILLNGEMYTWGSAQCGKLGHGSAVDSMTSPRLLRLGDRVEHLSCGAQHTAVLNGQGRLFTFGAGWYGRLGHGSTHNQSYPKHVEKFDPCMTGASPGGRPPLTSDNCVLAPKVLDVKCATHHTCIVAADQTLWCCGRDSMVCEPAHVLRPTRFGKDAHGFGDARVKAIAVGAYHTLCLTEDGNLWAWGDNGKGQLGLGRGSGSRLLQPALIGMPDLVADGSEIADIAAGYFHSMALLSSGGLCTWGSSAGGRLGLSQPAVEGAAANGAVWSPARVDMCWDADPPPAAAPPEEQAEERAEPAPPTQEAAREPQSDREEDNELDVLGELQRRLHRETHNQKLPALRDLEQELVSKLEKHFHDISELWGKPANDEDMEVEATEWDLHDLEGRLDRSLCRNLRRLSIDDEYPNLDSLLLPTEITQVLVYYEELIWILQQQPCYLAQLSLVHFKGLNVPKEAAPSDIFQKSVHHIFRELGCPRTRHLFMALIRRVIGLELQRPEVTDNTNLEWMFDPRTSTVPPLLSMLVTHPIFKRLHGQFFDADIEDSLLMKVSHWTLKRRRNNKSSNDAKQKPAGVSAQAIFALEVADLLQWEKGGDRHLMSEKEQAEQTAHFKARLNEYQNTFQQFLGINQANSNACQADSPTFVRFIEKLELDEDIRSILAKAAESIVRHAPAKPTGKTEKTVYEPIVKLLLSMFGHVLEAHESIMASQMLLEKFKMKVRKAVEEYMRQMGGPTTPSEKEISDAVAKDIRLMHFNLAQLGKFFILATRKDFKKTQRFFADQATAVKDGCMLEFTRKQTEQGQDDTGIKLTLDLYKSHYDTSEHFVMIRTSELLHLSNVLWLCIEKIALAHRPEETRLYYLLDRIQPPAAPQDGSRLWTPAILKKVSDHDMMHNFVVRHRFLQFHKGDLCFCAHCEAPIARMLAPEWQRQRKQVELLKVYPESHGRDEFLDLESVMANQSIDIKHSKSFIAMKYKLEEAQKCLSQKLSPHFQDDKSRDVYAFLTLIEKGKKSIDSLRSQGVMISKFVEHLYDALTSRETHCKYLEALVNALPEIVDCRSRYTEHLNRRIDGLKRIVHASESAAVAPFFRNRASEEGIRLKLMDVEKLRKKEEQNDKVLGGPTDVYSSATFSLYNLIAKRVVRRMGGDLPSKEHGNVFFTFNYMENEDWEVVVIHRNCGKSHMLCTFCITMQDTERMKRAGKCEKREFNNGFVVMSCFSLLQLLVRVHATLLKA